jgi:hypothetical protein
MKKKVKVNRVIRGRIYERTISNLSRITSNEAATMIGITLRHLYHLITFGKLRTSPIIARTNGKGLTKYLRRGRERVLTRLEKAGSVETA